MESLLEQTTEGKDRLARAAERFGQYAEAVQRRAEQAGGAEPGGGQPASVAAPLAAAPPAAAAQSSASSAQPATVAAALPPADVAMPAAFRTQAAKRGLAVDLDQQQGARQHNAQRREGKAASDGPTGDKRARVHGADQPEQQRLP